MYEISRLIYHVIGNDIMKEKEFVEKLGFKHDIYTGYSRLRALMINGKCDDDMRGRLPKALGIESKFVEEALKKTDKKISKQLSIMQKQMEDLQRKRFKPYLWIEHEYDKLLYKSNIETHRYESLKTIELPTSINSLDWEDQIKIIRNIINLDQKKNTSKVFGNPVSYIYFKDTKESYLFDNYGGLIKTFNNDKKIQYATA